jgi:hypothetical protein
VRRRRVKVGDRVEHALLGLGDVVHADGAGLTVSFDLGLCSFDATFAKRFLVIVEGGAS